MRARGLRAATSTIDACVLNAQGLAQDTEHQDRVVCAHSAQEHAHQHRDRAQRGTGQATEDAGQQGAQRPRAEGEGGDAVHRGDQEISVLNQALQGG